MIENLFPMVSSVRLVVFLLASAIAVFIFNWLMRKVMEVERKPIFSYNHLNEFHKKADWTIRWITVGGYIFLLIFAFDSFIFGMFLLGMVSVSAQEILRMIMERKYAENPKDYLYTFITLVTTFVIVFSIAQLLFPDLFQEMLTNSF
ncbi:DUF4181 domain-containing protein [Planomicrobium sp. YIM 101495]|uniref:DUF4181 domain-containing protein n=1 Tax=Planomicrobium sp. YIM 101495 TaxID=2665160 RepID=UPI0012B6C6EE|nr:DUF4181 domain-containing protein [Planomicrobium sp. YIM 101495]MTD31966.1 DUF4181 domain-containing protein [Planomicrobium sp. YIM 101495]